MKAVSGLALLVAILAVPTAGWAATGFSLDQGVLLADRFAQRTDVDEVLLPPRPTGPATPSPFCNPSAPFCP